MELILREDVQNLGFKDEIVSVKNGYGRNFLNKRAEEIKALEIQIPSKVGSGDKLFGSVTNADLADAISAKTSELDKKHITLPGKSIKRLGKYEASIRLHREVSFDLPFEIIPDTKA